MALYFVASLAMARIGYHEGLTGFRMSPAAVTLLFSRSQRSCISSRISTDPGKVYFVWFNKRWSIFAIRPKGRVDEAPLMPGHGATPCPTP